MDKQIPKTNIVINENINVHDLCEYAHCDKLDVDFNCCDCLFFDTDAPKALEWLANHQLENILDKLGV